MEQLLVKQEAELMDIEFINFILDSNFYYKNNLKIAYFLIHSQTCNVSEAARVIERSRRIIQDNVLFNNPCFVSEEATGYTSRQGGHQRRVILSKTARGYIVKIEELAIERLGKTECHRLKGQATRIRTGGINKVDGYKKRIKLLRKRSNRPGHMQHVIACAKDFQKKKEEVLKDIAGGAV